MKKKGTIVLRLAILKAIVKGIETGNIGKYIEPLLIRGVGKPKETIEHKGSVAHINVLDAIEKWKADTENIE